jgi:hypothetical protein
VISHLLEHLFDVGPLGGLMLPEGMQLACGDLR